MLGLVRSAGSLITPFAQGVQALLPKLTNGNYINNYTGFHLAQRVSTIPSLKVDQSLGAKGKVAFYWGNTGTDAQFSTPNGNADGPPNTVVDVSTAETSLRIDGWNSTSSNACRARLSESSPSAAPSV